MVGNPLLHIERAVVVSLYESEDYNLPYSDVDENVFTHPMHKWLVKQIKKAKDENIPLGLLRARLEEKLDGSEWEGAYLDLISTNPLYNWKQYYIELRAKYAQRKVKKLLGE